MVPQPTRGTHERAAAMNDRSRTTVRTMLVGAAVGVLLLMVAGCASSANRAASSASEASASRASVSSVQSLVDEAIGIKEWPPLGYSDNGDVAWVWTPGTEVDCKSYQDRCFGVTVVAKYGCSNGVYIEIAVLDSSGAAVDKANEITAALGQGDVAKAVLSPPGGAPKGAKAKLTTLNCLG